MDEGLMLWKPCKHGSYYDHGWIPWVNSRTSDRTAYTCTDAVRVTVDNKALDRAVQAYAEAEGFISPSDDAYTAMRAALQAIFDT